MDIMVQQPSIPVGSAARTVHDVLHDRPVIAFVFGVRLTEHYMAMPEVVRRVTR
jgi:hypothetical protein